jgi:hypothetical protein
MHGQNLDIGTKHRQYEEVLQKGWNIFKTVVIMHPQNRSRRRQVFAPWGGTPGSMLREY